MIGIKLRKVHGRRARDQARWEANWRVGCSYLGVEEGRIEAMGLGHGAVENSGAKLLVLGELEPY